MLIIPAIDLKDNKCVRLTEGIDETSIVFNDDPKNESIKKILMLSSVFVNDVVPMLTSFDAPLESLDNITAVDFFISSEYLNCFKS